MTIRQCIRFRCWATTKSPSPEGERDSLSSLPRSTHNDSMRAEQSFVMRTNTMNLHTPGHKAGVMPLIILGSVGRGAASLSFPRHDGFEIAYDK